MPLVHPFLRTLITPPKPQIVGITTNVSTSSPLTLTFPTKRHAGILMLVMIRRHAGGTAVPGTPTGFTNLAGASSAPAWRMSYKFFDGSEGLSTTSAATSATSMTGFVVAIEGCVNWTPLAQVLDFASGNGTNTTPDPPAFSTTELTVRRPYLYIAWTGWNGNGSVTEFPAGYCLHQTQFVQGSNGGQALCAKYGGDPTEDPGPFTLSASLNYRVGAFAIAGA